MSMKEIADIIAEARDYLERHGWIRGELSNDQGVCSLGAIIYSQGWDDEMLDPEHKELMDKVTQYLGMAVVPEIAKVHLEFNVPAWNDAEDREEQEVLDAFMKAEKIARSGNVEVLP